MPTIMYVDTLTLQAVVAELRDTVVGGHIQRVLQPTDDSIGLEIYAGRRYHLLLSAHPQRARIQLVSAKLTRSGDGDSPLMLLLRKYVKHAVITAVTQPSLERIVRLSITKQPAPASDDEEEITAPRHSELVIEILGGRSNILLLHADGRIMDVVRRISHDQRRPLQPHIVYTPPVPAPAERDPHTATAREPQPLVAQGGDVVKGVVGLYRGVSPLVAREALFRATGMATAQWHATLPLDALAAELSALYNQPFTPSLATTDEGLVAFAPYHLDQYPQVTPVDSISLAMEQFFAAAEQGANYAARRTALAARLANVQVRYGKQREALQRELERAQTFERLRWEGEMMYAYLHAIAPGATAFEVEGQRIALDPGKTVVENAQMRFRAYDKAKGALEGVPERLVETEGNLAYLEETLALLEVADSFDAISGIEREAEENGLLRSAGGKKPKGPRATPLRVMSSEGVPILVGRSAGQNEAVTFTLSQPDDIWLHARGRPGAHVIIRSNEAVGDQTLLEAAGLALYFSKARHEAAADVTLCRRRDVRKVPGGPPGLVTLRNERTLHVPPVAPGELGRTTND